MKKNEAIKEVCEIVSLVHNSIGDYSHPSDCFCEVGNMPDPFYQNTGEAIKFVREAVVEKLYREGYQINSAYDPETGRMKE